MRHLSRFDPPSFDGRVHATIKDAAEAQFQATMAFYKRGAYAMAIPGLLETLELDSRAVDASFYLGICLLMTGEVEEGEQTLEDTIAWGDTPYREPALTYAAHANMQLYRADRAHAMFLDTGKSLSKMLTEP